MRIVLTRPAGADDELERCLTAAGHEVVHEPLIAIEPLGDDPVDVTGYDWVVITSPNGARELRRRMVGSPARLAAIGAATAAAFGGADLVAAVSTQEGLLAVLPRPAGRVLFAGAEGARPLLATELDADVVALYRTVELTPELPVADLAVLTSASAARALAQLDHAGPVVSIGPETTRVAAAGGLDVVAEAITHDVAGLVDAVDRVGRTR